MLGHFIEVGICDVTRGGGGVISIIKVYQVQLVYFKIEACTSDFLLFELIV